MNFSYFDILSSISPKYIAYAVEGLLEAGSVRVSTSSADELVKFFILNGFQVCKVLDTTVRLFGEDLPSGNVCTLALVNC